jgi:hypothetical protein
MDDRLMSTADQSTHHVRAHAPQPDHADLHQRSLSLPAGRLPERLRDGGVQGCESGGDIRSHVDAQRPPATRAENLEVSASLRRLHHTERIGLPRHRDVLGHIVRNLKEDT